MKTQIDRIAAKTIRTIIAGDGVFNAIRYVRRFHHESLLVAKQVIQDFEANQPWTYPEAQPDSSEVMHRRAINWH